MLTTVLAGPDQLTAAGSADRTLSIYNIHTKDTVTVVYKRNGQYVPAAMKKLNWVMRDWRRDEAAKMDPKLIDTIWQIHSELRSKRPVYLISGYRSRKTNDKLRKSRGGQARNSRHILGKAADIHFPDVPIKQLRYSALIHESGGVGYYPTSALPFVHVDTGRIRHWPRMGRTELALLSRGRTRHVPRDRKPIRRADYQRALRKSRALATRIATYHRKRSRAAQTVVAAATVPDPAAPSWNIPSPRIAARPRRPARRQVATLTSRPAAAPIPRPRQAARPTPARPTPARPTPTRQASLQLQPARKPRAPRPKATPRLASLAPDRAPGHTTDRGEIYGPEPPVRLRLQLPESVRPNPAAQSFKVPRPLRAERQLGKTPGTPPRNRTQLASLTPATGTADSIAAALREIAPEPDPESDTRPTALPADADESEAGASTRAQATPLNTFMTLSGWVTAPEYDSEHPGELSYRPFPIGPLLSNDTSVDAPALARLVHPDLAGARELIAGDVAGLPLRFKPGLQYAEMLWSDAFASGGINALLSGDPALRPWAQGTQVSRATQQ